MLRTNRLTTTLAYQSGTVRVSIKALRLLSEPQYITLMINMDSNQLAFVPSTKEDRAALKVRYRGSINKNGKFVNSCKLVRKIFDLEKWDSNYRYQIPGIFMPEANVAYFDLSKAKKVFRNFNIKERDDIDGIN